MASRDGDTEHTDRRLRKTSIAWTYFTLVDEEKHIAACNTCDAHMSFRSSISNLMKHIKRKHGDIEPRMSEDEKGSESEVEESNKINLDDDDDKLQSSTAWVHFDITSAEKKIATCSICQVPLSYKHSVQGLLKHLSRKHGIGEETEAAEQSDDEEKKADSSPGNYRSAIWPYFRVTDAANKTARCLVCKKPLSYNTGTSNLRKHLQRKHPMIKIPGPGEERKTIILSSGDQLYEFETMTKGEHEEEDDDNDAQNEPIAIDEVFLDEFNGSINRIESDKKYKSKKRKHKAQKKEIVIEPSDSDDELVLKKKYAKKEQDSIDLFAKYVASLLKELPKQTANRLQKDFVQQIMNAQCAQVEHQSNASVSNNAYSITIAEASEDVRFEVVAKAEAANKDSDSQGDVWSFFERCAAGARCAVCRALVPKDSLREHLRTSHPKLLDQESEEETTNNTQEDVYTEIVYLENEDNIKKSPKTVEKVRKPRKSIKTEPRPEPLKRKYSSSSDEEPLKFKKEKNDDEIEQFGKYVTCLLKKVPQEVSMELQMDIVNLIMKKQLELKRKEMTILAPTESKMAAVRTADDSCQNVEISYERIEDTSFNNSYISNGGNDAKETNAEN